jgi:hypothetical protein
MSKIETLKLYETEYTRLQHLLISTRKQLHDLMQETLILYQAASFEHNELPPSRVIPAVYGHTTTKNAVIACLSNVIMLKTADLIEQVKECRPGTKKQSVYVLLGRMKEEGLVTSPAHGYWQLVKHLDLI